LYALRKHVVLQAELIEYMLNNTMTINFDKFCKRLRENYDPVSLTINNFD